MLLDHAMKWLAFAIILSTCVTACTWRHNPHYNYKRLKSTDSVEVEKHGDTVYKYYLNYDRKHDHYCPDKMLTNTIVYKMIANDTAVRSNSFLIQGDYLFFLDREKAKHCIDSLRLGYYVGWSNAENIGSLGTLEFSTELIGNCKMKILDTKTNSIPGGILCEQFSSKYYQGTNYYLISGSGDTILLFKKTNYRY